MRKTEAPPLPPKKKKSFLDLNNGGTYIRPPFPKTRKAPLPPFGGGMPFIREPDIEAVGR
jgi:hypothetical protein